MAGHGEQGPSPNTSQKPVDELGPSHGRLAGPVALPVERGGRQPILSPGRSISIVNISDWAKKNYAPPQGRKAMNFSESGPLPAQGAISAANLCTSCV